MTIFNSLGSNYDLKFAFKALFSQNRESYGKKLKDFLEKKYNGKAILVYKGREAIELALEILHLPKHSFVVVNGFTCYAVYKAVINEGYDAEILDLPPSSDGSDLNFSAETLKIALKHNPKIKAVIIQNTLGYPCDIEKISKVCGENNIVLIEDLAHSIGSIYANGKEAGSPYCEAGVVGDFVVLSFSQDKIIDAVSGGALIIKNKKYSNLTIQQFSNINGYQQLKDRLYPLFAFLIRKTYGIGLGKLTHLLLKSLNLLSNPMNESFYTKYNLPNWYAYLTMSSFANLNKNLEHRRQIVHIYNSMLSKKITSERIGRNIKFSSNLRFPIFVDNRASLIKYLKNQGVYVSDIWYDSVDENLTKAKIISDRIVNLPTHINISTIDATLLAKKINLWLQLQ